MQKCTTAADAGRVGVGSGKHSRVGARLRFATSGQRLRGGKGAVAAGRRGTIGSGSQRRQMFFAVDEDDRIHSVVYLIWDNRAAYYLIAGDDPNLRSSGASIFLVWEAIKYTKGKLGLNCFDFMGSMFPAIEKVRRNFGAEKTL